MYVFFIKKINSSHVIMKITKSFTCTIYFRKAMQCCSSPDFYQFYLKFEICRYFYSHNHVEYKCEFAF